MANKEPYDYLSEVAADVDQILIIKAQGRLLERGSKNQVIHIGDDGAEKRINLDSTSIFYVEFPWRALSESDAGTIMDLWHDSSKANGKVNSFKWSHPSDGHTYVARFDNNLDRERKMVAIYGFGKVRMKLLGYIAD